MPSLLSRRHGVRGSTAQAAAYHSRRRRLSNLDPRLGLFRTHTFTTSDTAIDVGDGFPGDRLEPITICLDMKITGASPNGLLFEFGDATRGLAAAIDGTDLIVGAGAAAASNDGVTVTASAALLENSTVNKIAVVVFPNTGTVNIWVNGDLVASDVSVSGDFGGAWAADALGAIATKNGDAIDRIAGPQAVALADAEIVTEVEVYNKQHPRQTL